MVRLNRTIRRLALATLLVATGLSIDAAAVGAQGFRHGENVVFSGVVTDERGAPVRGLRIVLEASKRRFTIYKLRRQDRGLVRLSTLSDDTGAYSFDWEWNSYYNHFRLHIVEGTGSARRDEELEPLVTVAVKKPAERGNPVVVSLAVAASAFLVEHRQLMDSMEGADQERIYEEMGKPDRVDRLPIDEGDETTWWYFERGKAYRFRGGELDQVDEFDPVKPF